MADGRSRQVDIHVIRLDDQGNGLYGPMSRGEAYPAAALVGAGVIEERAVRCISPEWQVKFHTGYALRETDEMDVAALRRQFELPPLETAYRWTHDPVVQSAVDHARASMIDRMELDEQC